jgi:hypothetical protein
MTPEEEQAEGDKIAKEKASARAEALLKLYGMLTDQVHKNSTLLWAIPTALVAANAYAISNLALHPGVTVAVAFFDGAMTFTCFKIRRTQNVLILAVQKIEDESRKNDPGYGEFFPKFPKHPEGKKKPLGAADIVIGMLGIMSAAMFGWGSWGVWKICYP